ncbi:MAG: hypothetical protein AAF965_10965 [Pseudomonadota bacterium]
MPPIGRIVVTNVGVGFVLAAVFVALLLWFNIGGLGHLVSVVGGGWLMLLPLWVMFGGLFTCVQFIIAGLCDDDDDDDHPRGGRRDPENLRRDHAPIPVRSDESQGPFWSRR